MLTKILQVMRKKSILIALSFIALISIVVVIKVTGNSVADDYNQITVERGDVLETVSVTGTVIPAKQIDLQFETSGKIQEVLVRVGDKVEAGDTLIRLNTSELSAQLQSYQAALEITKVKLEQELAGIKPEDIKIYETAVENAKLDVATKEQALIDAEINAEDDLRAAYEDALDTCKTAYTQADKALYIVYTGMQREYFYSSNQLAIGVREYETKAKNELRTAEELLEWAESTSDYVDIESALSAMQDAIKETRDALAYLRAAMDDSSIASSVTAADETTVDTERTTINGALVELTSAQQTITSTETTNQTSINTAQANLDAARIALIKAEDELASKKAGPRESDLALLEAQIKQAEADVRQIQAKLSKLILVAPVDGVITAVEKDKGETVPVNSTVVSMINSGYFQIEANISETEIARIELSDRIGITLDAFGPDERFPGQILEIDPAETVVSGVVYYTVTSVFDVEDERIKSGMTVNLDIETNKQEDVLYLPYYAISEEDDQKQVLVLVDNKIEERIVETGLEGEMKVEITDGLEEGEIVLVGK